ncbi:N-acetyltransferase [Marmoricola endophyticus]|uniref:N-acetyltransferase n=1 Tax=Marmoricola endophyticus TaxID=2040280 RepID=A0A917BHS3_9ACTN|nr:GNAT family N-acetyltransferase [Marmoricola endophyticus]GGF45900.1 N-acetyltransferase [Marmoricola endophyticus]
MTTWTVRTVTAADTADLRREVLRGGKDHPPLGDDPADHSLHLGAYDGELLVGSGNVRPLPDGSWRVRGMAVEPAYRGRGVGAEVLAGLLAHVAASGGGPVWCHARTGARSLYERAGFVAVGEPWVDPDIGPHVRMERPA